MKYENNDFENKLEKPLTDPPGFLEFCFWRDRLSFTDRDVSDEPGLRKLDRSSIFEPGINRGLKIPKKFMYRANERWLFCLISATPWDFFKKSGIRIPKQILWDGGKTF